MEQQFNAKALRVKLDKTLENLTKGKSLLCMPIINRELNSTWDAVKPYLCSKSMVCGKSWADQQFGYRCRTCETDATCIVCIECFQPEKHVGHDYSLKRTCGGMCDCGDRDAWDPKGFCDVHQGIPVEIDLSKIPEKILDWLYELAGFHLTALRKGVEGLDSSVEYTKLRVAIMGLAKNLTMLVHIGDVGRHIVARAFCEGKDEILQSLFDHECTVQRAPWEGTSSLLYDLVSALLPDAYFKLHFAKKMVVNYMALCIRTPASHVPKRSLLDFSVQIFTNPTLCKRLLIPEELGNSRVHVLHILLSNGIRCSPIANHSIAHNFHYRFSVVNFVLTDLSYLLNSAVEAIEILFRDELLLSFFCLLLSAAQMSSYVHDSMEDIFPIEIFQSMNKSVQTIFGAIKRSIPDLLNNGFTVEKKQPLSICRTIEGSSKDAFLEEMFKHVKKYNIDFAREFGKWRKYISQYLTEYHHLSSFHQVMAFIIDFLACETQFMKEKIGSLEDWHSFLLPFHRFITILSSATQPHVEDVIQTIPHELAALHLENFCIQPLRLQRLRTASLPQNIDNLEMELRMQYYEGSSQLEEDLSFLQLACCSMGPSDFCEKLIGEILYDHTGGGRSSLLILHLLITIAVHTEESFEKRLEQSVMNVLALEPQTYSCFYKRHTQTYISREDGEDTEAHDIDAVFSKVSQRTNTTNPGKYVLKKECLEEMTIYHSGIAFSDIIPLVDAVTGLSESASLLPKLPNDGQRLCSILLLHVHETHAYVHRQLLKIYNATIKGTDRVLLFRFILDFVLCSVRTIQQRDAVCLRKNFSVVAQLDLVHSDGKPSVVDILHSITRKFEHSSARKLKSSYTKDKSILEMVTDLRERAVFEGLQPKIDEVIRSTSGNEGITSLKIDIPNQPRDHAQAMQHQQKALAKFQAKQKAFESLGLMDDEETDESDTTPSPEAATLGRDMREFYTQALCVSCHEPSKESDGLGLIVHAMHSNVLRVVNRSRFPKKEKKKKLVPDEIYNLQNPWHSTWHITTCSHLIHEDCLHKLILHNRSLETDRGSGERRDLVRLSVSYPPEFLCPACGGLSSGIVHFRHPTGSPPNFISLSAVSGSVDSESLWKPSDMVEPIRVPGIEISRAQSTLAWIYSRARWCNPFREETLEFHSGSSHLEYAIRAFGIQIVLLEIQARYDNTLLHLRKLILLQVQLQNIIIAFRTYSQESKEIRKNADIQSSIISLLEKKVLPSIDKFTLLVHLMVRLVLTRDDWRAPYAYVMDVVRRCLKAIKIEDEKRIFLRQFTILHMVLCPGIVPTEKITVLDSVEDVLCQALNNLFPRDVLFTIPHAPTSLAPIEMPFLSSAPDNFWDFLRKFYPLKCKKSPTYARRRAICCYCGTLVCLAPCCPYEHGEHSDLCGEGTGLYVNISPNSSEIFLHLPCTSQCASLTSPWLNEYGEEDIGCHRGKPLWKDSHTVRVITRYWLEGSHFQDPKGIIKRSWLETSEIF